MYTLHKYRINPAKNYSISAKNKSLARKKILRSPQQSEYLFCLIKLYYRVKAVQIHDLNPASPNKELFMRGRCCKSPRNRPISEKHLRQARRQYPFGHIIPRHFWHLRYRRTGFSPYQHPRQYTVQR